MITLLRVIIPGLPSFWVTVTKRDELVAELVGWDSEVLADGGLAKRNPAAFRGRLALCTAPWPEVFWRLVIGFAVQGLKETSSEQIIRV